MVLVPTAPRELRVLSASDTSLYVTWSSPQPINGVVQQYRLFYWTTHYNNSVLIAASLNVYNITALNPATNYSIQV